MHNHQKIENDLKNKIIRILSEQLGTEPDEISEEDSFKDDLLMSPSDLTDFLANLEKNGIPTTDIDFSTIELVSDLIEFISTETIIS